MLNLFKPGGSKRRAMVFVDYESWFYSYKTLYNMRPDPKEFRNKLEAEYDIEDIMVFGDFSSPVIAEELGKLRSITNTIIETGNTFNRRKKDMTDFIMLDYIYQYADQNKRTGTYIIFTGDGHFQSVIKYLSQKKKKHVIIYGVTDSISRQLRDAASEVRELPTDSELMKRNYSLIIKNMDYVYKNPRIIPTFMGTAEAVAKHNNINIEEIKCALSEMLDKGYLTKGFKRVGYSSVKVLYAEWDKLQADGLWSPDT